MAAPGMGPPGGPSFRAEGAARPEGTPEPALPAAGPVKIQYSGRVFCIKNPRMAGKDIKMDSPVVAAFRQATDDFLKTNAGGLPLGKNYRVSYLEGQASPKITEIAQGELPSAREEMEFDISFEGAAVGGPGDAAVRQQASARYNHLVNAYKTLPPHQQQEALAEIRRLAEALGLPAPVRVTPEVAAHRDLSLQYQKKLEHYNFLSNLLNNVRLKPYDRAGAVHELDGLTKELNHDWALLNKLGAELRYPPLPPPFPPPLSPAPATPGPAPLAAPLAGRERADQHQKLLGQYEKLLAKFQSPDGFPPEEQPHAKAHLDALFDELFPGQRIPVNPDTAVAPAPYAGPGHAAPARPIELTPQQKLHSDLGSRYQSNLDRFNNVAYLYNNNRIAPVDQPRARAELEELTKDLQNDWPQLNKLRSEIGYGPLPPPFPPSPARAAPLAAPAAPAAPVPPSSPARAAPLAAPVAAAAPAAQSEAQKAEAKAAYLARVGEYEKFVKLYQSAYNQVRSTKISPENFSNNPLVQRLNSVFPQLEKQFNFLIAERNRLDIADLPRFLPPPPPSAPYR